MEQGAKGNFRINFNTKKQAGDSQPVLERGIISTPDAPEERFEVKMWAYTDAAGRVFYAGPSSEIRRDAVGLDRAEALTLAEVRAVDVAEVEKSAETAEGITLSPHRVMLFRNGFKIAKNDPRHGALSDADKAVNDKRPDLYGFWNPGADATGKPGAIEGVGLAARRAVRAVPRRQYAGGAACQSRRNNGQGFRGGRCHQLQAAPRQAASLGL